MVSGCDPASDPILLMPAKKNSCSATKLAAARKSAGITLTIDKGLSKNELLKHFFDNSDLLLCHSRCLR